MGERRDRRQFGKEVAGLAAATCVGGVAPGLAAQPEQPKNARTISLQALTEMVRAQYGAHLSDDQLQQVRQKIASGLLMAEALKKVPLTNGDEPDFVFQAS
jgi:hypothetical protein